MRVWTAIRIAARDLRGGLQSLRVFVVCLALGVAALAGVGSVLSAIEEGLSRSGRDALGGDIELRLVHRTATTEEQAYLRRFGPVSEVIGFRGMVAKPEASAIDRVLVQVKAVDDGYPLYGELITDPPLSVDDALNADSTGRFGLVAAPELVARLGLSVGDPMQLGTTTLELRATLVTEPDRVTTGLRFGPRVIVKTAAIAGSGLLAAGSLYYPRYRIQMPADIELDAVRTAVTGAFPDAGWSWRDRRAGAPGVERFIQRIGAFLTLVGLAALALGGVGAGSAVRAYMQRKLPTIATLRTLGATRRMVAMVYLGQILAITTIGIALGLLLGVGLPAVFGPIMAEYLPVPAAFGVYGLPVVRAAVAGYLVGVLFSLLPLARACEMPAAALFRDEVAPSRIRVHPVWFVAVTAIIAVLVALAIWFSGDPILASVFAASFASALVLLALAGQGAAWSARHFAARLMRLPPMLRRGVAQVGGAGGDARGISVALGISLTLLAAIALTDHSLRSAITELADEDTPDYFVLDITNDQLPQFQATAAQQTVDRTITAPMLRGFVTALNGIPAAEASVDPEGEWVLRGDRGLSYANAPPENSTLVAGEWWTSDYAGPPLVSFAAEEAQQLGLAVGSTVAVNVLGRPLTATVANLREVEWQTMGMNFLMIYNPAALASAPHAHIATVYLPDDRGATFLESLGECCPAATAVSVSDALVHARATLGQIAAAALWGSAVTLLTGFAVLAGVAAASQRRQIYESAIMKALGATRPEILATLATRWIILGGLAATLALGLGALGAWGTLRFVLDIDFAFSASVALITVAAGVSISLVAGMAFAGAALRASPATLLRSRE